MNIVTLAAFPVFFLSGFAALLYQVIWQRLLTLFSGADVYSATVVVAVFMAGLGVGSLGGGHLADRVSRRTSLLLFCASELAIGAFGAVSGTFFHDVLYERVGAWSLSQPAIVATIFASLLAPTACMGASLPLLARAITAEVGHAAPRIGALYGFNTMGAAVGALCGTWLLIPMRGLAGSLDVAVVANVVCALALLPCGLLPSLHRGVAAPAEAPKAVSSVEGETARSIWLWAALSACTGFIALSLEVAWFRLLGVMMKSTAFTFGSLLTCYLVGLGLGALVGSSIAGRLRRPVRVFLLLQAGVALATGALVVLLMFAATEHQGLLAYFGEYEHLDVKHYAVSIKNWLTEGAQLPDLGLFPLVYLGLPTLLVLVPTFLMGCAFPVLQRIVHGDLPQLGRRIGILLVSNIIGSAAGAVATGLFLLGVFGTAGTLKLLVAGGAMFWILGLAVDGEPRKLSRWPLAVATGVLVFGALLAVMPDAATLWARLHGTDEAHLIFREDGSGLSTIKTRHAGEDRPVVFVNGLGESYMPYGGLHSALAALPAFVHGAPRTVAVIGLGSGDTVHAMAGHPSIERIAAIEIVRPQLGTLRALSAQHSDNALAAMLANQRIEHVFGDGRAYLTRTSERFDIIEADALRPTSAYSGNLYSEDYFRLVRSRLAARGLAVTWRASDRVHNTFVRVFPHVLALREMLIGSNDPIVIDREVLASRVAHEDVVRYYRRAGIDIGELVQDFFENPVVLGPNDPRDLQADVNTDLDPRDEFDIDLR